MGTLTFVSLKWKCEANQMSKTNVAYNRRSEWGKALAINVGICI